MQSSHQVFLVNNHQAATFIMQDKTKTQLHHNRGEGPGRKGQKFIVVHK